jgi:hypothetical protein
MANVVFEEEKMFPVFMPSLLSRFRDAEAELGSPLTSRQAREIRDNAAGVLLPEPIASKLEERRGFRDLDPKNFWNDWQEFRLKK